ncbi:hypothetical protein Nepgr_003815 [Nepenthes gracilis]|uniref:Uncharacterized protein n=1 Tax=Nepenthes gracilis TaxID=150966 RepID=A0AAD3S079_NEPGR|nr:hypothetical protein Nepgr_003815 [Nepenthes gracilis]
MPIHTAPSVRSAPSVAKAGSNKVKSGIAPSVISPALADFAQNTTKSWSHVAQFGDLNTLVPLKYFSLAKESGFDAPLTPPVEILAGGAESAKVVEVEIVYYSQPARRNPSNQSSLQRYPKGKRRLSDSPLVPDLGDVGVGSSATSLGSLSSHVLIEVNWESPVSGEPVDGDPGIPVGVEGSSSDCALDAVALKLEVDSGLSLAVPDEGPKGVHYVDGGGILNVLMMKVVLLCALLRTRLGHIKPRLLLQGIRISLAWVQNGVSSIGYTSVALGGNKLSEPLKDNQLALNPDHLASCRAMDALANAAAFFHSHVRCLLLESCCCSFDESCVSCPTKKKKKLHELVPFSLVQLEPGADYSCLKSLFDHLMKLPSGIE